jgi:hypothetical protein
MAKQPAPTTEQLVSRTTTYNRSAGFSSRYANNVNIAVTPWDIRFTFGVIEEADAEHIVFENHTEVYMSPQHAKAFASVLARRIAEYESTFALIPEFGRPSGESDEEKPPSS